MPWSSIITVAVIVIVTSLATLLIMARLLRPFYGGSTWDAFSHQLRLVTGRTQGFQIIEDGRAIYPIASGPVLGPRLIIIRPGNAVTMINGGKITRVLGSGIFKSNRFEYVKDVFDLRERQKSFTIEDVLSHDLIETSALVTLSYTLDISEAARQGAESLAPEEVDLLKRLPFSMPKWEEATRGALEQSVRQVVSSQGLEALLVRAHYRPLEQRIMHLTNDRTLAWGVRARNVIIECLRPEPEITGAASTLWIAGENIGVEVAKSRAFRDALLIVADAYRTAAEMGMPEDGIRREILRRTLEQMGKDPATKIVITPELPSTYSATRRSNDADSTD